MKPKYAIIYDLETSGLDEKRHDITQIAALAYNLETLEAESAFEAKVQFDMDKASQEALSVNSYNKEVWDREAKSASIVARAFDSFVSSFKYSFVSKRGNNVQTGFACGHNWSRFDGPFLQAWYKRLSIWCPIGFKGLDTLQLALALETIDSTVDFKDNYTLEGVAKTLGIQIKDDLHDAMADVRLTAKVLTELLQRFSANRSK